MKKIVLILIVALTYVSCQQDSTLEETNEFEQLNLELSSNLDQSRAASLPPPICTATTSWNSSGFSFSYTDTAAWGNLIRIRPVDAGGVRGIGKMYTIDASTGIAFVPIGHGINIMGEYIFSVEEMQNALGAPVTFCGLNYLFN